MSVKITYFVHGTTTDNEHDLATGWSPGELSELGIKQAKELGEIVSDKEFDEIFCSDLKRAVDSAKLGFGDKYITNKRLRECDYGDFTGKPAKEFKNNMEEYIDNSFPNGESYREVEERMADFLEFLRRNYEGKHVAIVAHQAPQLALEVLTKGKSWKQAIKEDWRKKGEWQAGWDYFLRNKVLILHGWESNSKEHWFLEEKERLEKSGFKVVLPDMPNSSHPKKEEWVNVIKEFNPDKNSILIGHSLGGTAILRYLEKTNKQILKSIIIATPFEKLGNPEIDFSPIENFLEPGFNWEKIKQNCKEFIIINQTNDPYVPSEQGKNLSDHLEGCFVEVEGNDHFDKIDFSLLEKYIHNFKK